MDPRMTSNFDSDTCRRQFPALGREVDGRPAVFFDGPAGSQVPRRVIDAVGDYLAGSNANHGGSFLTSRESDAMLAEAHRAAADFMGSADAELVAFGANMTTLTFSLSRALAKTWRAGDEVIVSRSAHDANFTPWVLAAADAGATVKYVDIRGGDCSLDLEELASMLCERTRLVAVACASNFSGTIHPVEKIAALAHEVGAQVFLDAVHYAPHAPLAVEQWDCDFLVCSAYKFFGPHVGLLWGKRRWMEELPAYKVRPAEDAVPDRWMTGTQNHEGIAGVLAAIDYLADLSRDEAGPADRREALLRTWELIGKYERVLLRRLLDGLAGIRGLKVWGITDPARDHERVPTVSFTIEGHPSGELDRYLAARGIFSWSGNFYALPLSEALDLEPGGALRVGLLHYNTAAEVDRFVEALEELVGG